MEISPGPRISMLKILVFASAAAPKIISNIEIGGPGDALGVLTGPRVLRYLFLLQSRFVF